MPERRPANRVIVGVALGRYQQAEWTMGWIPFVGAYQQYAVLHGHQDPGVVFASAPYVHQAQNQIIARCLLRPDWDYLLMLEDDQRAPDGLLARVGRYEEPIVGVLSFGRAQHDQRPIACQRGEDGRVARLSWE